MLINCFGPNFYDSFYEINITLVLSIRWLQNLGAIRSKKGKEKQITIHGDDIELKDDNESNGVIKTVNL